MLATRPIMGLALAAFLAALAGCAAGGGGNPSDARLLYNHCREAKDFLAAYIRHEGPKTMVAGLNYELDGRRTYSCYWKGGRDQAAAEAEALAACRQTYMKCYVYAQGNSEEDWVRHERVTAAQEQQRAVDEFVDGFIEGFGIMATP